MARSFLLLLLLLIALPVQAQERGHAAAHVDAQAPRDPGLFYKFVRSFSKEGAIKMWRGGQRPDLRTLLTLRGFNYGAPVYLRIFKEEEIIEAWLRRGDRYELFEIYPICIKSGELGPKLREGDGQAPEGFYEVGLKQLNPNSKYFLSFNLGYPNAFDRAHKRTGAALMVHGSCVSIGCYALTDANIQEVYSLVEAALLAGQASVPVHAYPFRMTQEALGGHQNSQWLRFWADDLYPSYQAFAATGIPPRMMTCEGRYAMMQDGLTPDMLPPQCTAIVSW